MKRRIIRTDLMSKSDYAFKYNISRVTVDKKIRDGELTVEVISDKEYIRLKQD